MQKKLPSAACVGFQSGRCWSIIASLTFVNGSW